MAITAPATTKTTMAAWSQIHMRGTAGRVVRNDSAMTHTDDLLANNAAYAADFDPGPPAHGAKVAVVTCMDARMDVWRFLGLKDGDAHVIRNAGGIVTDDEIRSIAISQRLLGSREIVVINHTGCGMLTFTDDDFRQTLEKDTGSRPDWAPGAFSDLDENVRAGMTRIRESPFIPHTDNVRGFVYELETGRLREVT
jgi:carbonic anhydrase